MTDPAEQPVGVEDAAEPTTAQIVDDLLEVLAQAGHEAVMLSTSPSLAAALKPTTPPSPRPTRSRATAANRRANLRITTSPSMADPSLLVMTRHQERSYVFTLADPAGLPTATAILPAALAAIAETPTLSGPSALAAARAARDTS